VKIEKNPAEAMANKEYLTIDANILQCPEFLSGVVKLIHGKENQLSPAEQVSLIGFKKPGAGNPPMVANLEEEKKDANQEDWADSVLSDLQKRKQCSISAYYSPNFVLATQVECERLFSITKYILEQQRSGMSDYSFEMTAFLKVHKDLWDPATVTAAVDGVVEE
jgi:hypothetical protein